MWEYKKKVKISLKFIFVLIILIIQLFSNIGYPNFKANATESENQLNEIYISEINYADNLKKTIEPHVNSRVEIGYLNGDENVKLYYEKYKADNAKGNIVISHGYTETLIKYHELIYYFLKNGYYG